MRGNALQMLEARAKRWQIYHEKRLIKSNLKKVTDRKKARKKYLYERSKYNMNARLASILRRRIARAIKHKNKVGSAVQDLGCTTDEFRFYLEGKFKDGMNWNTYGRNGWHIDHVIPLSFFDLTNREQFLKATHYTNLQPLWAIDNRKKSASYNAIPTSA